ncbi:MAG: BamA/TamA family outer membrane protein [Gemmatimonadales bacterium]|nr:BamA/TamA family outer membrane protein [Gemmatimonadales bacterium]
MIRRFVLAVLLAAAAAPAAAQEPWRSSYFPYLMGNPTDGFTVVGRWQRTRNAPYFVSRTDTEDVINPITFRGALSAEAGIGTLGSRFARVEFRAPGLVDGWRFRGLLGAERVGRFAYYGLGGDIERAESAADPNASFYRVHRSRYLSRAEVSRKIHGGLRVALAAALDRTDFNRLRDSSMFASQVGARVARTDLVLRPALVLDTRDLEFTPGNGLLLEVGAGFGTARESNPGDDQSLYAFGYAHLRGFISPREGTVIAGRYLVRAMEDAAPFAARFGLPGWERDVSFSGPDGHRSFPTGALAGTGVQLASLEVRHDLLNAGDLGAVTFVGFTDFAHVEDNAARFRYQTDQWGGGAGVALRVLRSAILSINFAGGANGFNFSMGTGWAF